MALTGLVGVVLAATSQAANATAARPVEPTPSVSPRLTAAMQAELMSDVLPASPPITLTDPVTDGAGALSDVERRSIRDAVERLADRSDLRMFVVYIESFDGTEPVDWANASANQSGFGTEDLLLAVATVDHQFGLSADSNVELTDAQLDKIDEVVADAVEDEQWAPAATGAADAVHRSTSGTTSPLLVAGLAVAAALVLGALGFVAWRFGLPRLQPHLARLAHRDPTSGSPARDELTGLSLTELDQRAAAALVGIDDALKTSEQELGFARAELGADATRDFELILVSATRDVRQAFAIRQSLDDTAEQEADRRTHLTSVITLCEDAADTLDARTRAFDDLRRLQQRAPEVLTDVVTREPEVTARVATAHATLERLAQTCPAGTLAMVTGNPEQAELLLTNAKEAVAAGRSALEAGRRAVAAAHARGAQNALGQATMLLDSVAAAATYLTEAARRLDTSVASLTQNVAWARSIEGDLEITLARTAAQAALKQVEVTRDGGDPLAGLERIAAAEAALDAALASRRDGPEVAARASALLRDTLSRVDAQLHQTADFIATRRGAVGSTARTRLAEAVRLTDVARSRQPADPVAALGTAQRASTLGQEAARIAREDADAAVAAAATEAEQDVAEGDANGPITGGMVLGGILLDPNLARSRRRSGTAHIGGGFGGGGFGGGRPGTVRRLGTVRSWWPTPAR